MPQELCFNFNLSAIQLAMRSLARSLQELMLVFVFAYLIHFNFVTLNWSMLPFVDVIPTRAIPALRLTIL